MKREVPLSFYIYYIINIFNCQFLFWFLPGSFAVFVSIFILFLGVFKWIFPRLKRVGYWRAGPGFQMNFCFGSRLYFRFLKWISYQARPDRHPPSAKVPLSTKLILFFIKINYSSSSDQSSNPFLINFLSHISIKVSLPFPPSKE